MPIWLRKFTYHKIQEWYNNEREEIEKSQGKNKQSIDVSRPNISSNPTYSTKAAKK